MHQVDEVLCTGCGVCVEACPVEAIHLEEGRARITQELCADCGACAAVCPEEAIVRTVQPARPSAAPLRSEPALPTSIPSTEIITVRVPPPPVEVAAAPSLARRVLPSVGAAIVFVGREIAPRVLRLATEVLEQRLARPARTIGRTKPSSRIGAGKRRRQRRRGKQ